MKRFFASDAESDMLIAEATKTFGLKIGDIINMAIKNQFLPITEPFRTEARFILQRHTEGALEAQEIKQSMTRGIRALGTRPMRDADRLQGFFARYHLHEDVENCTITENDALWESAVEVYNIPNSAKGIEVPCGGQCHARQQSGGQPRCDGIYHRCRHPPTAAQSGRACDCAPRAGGW